MGLVAELGRRNVIRMAGLYLVGAWLVVQVAGTVLPMFGAPGWMARSVVLLLAIGFVPALVFAWVFELTPEGIRRDADVPPEQSIAPHTARRMDRMIIAVLLLALVYFGVDKFVLAPVREAAVAATAAAPVAATPAVPTAQPRSIAVLPFVDMSQGKDQEYFSDGLSEQLLNALAQVPELHVAGRTSSFHFKGRNEDLRVIGRQLDVANVLEGSVARSGDTLRITAQLINADSGFHLWSRTYDRPFTDVFALQDEIVASVVAALKVELLQGSGPVSSRSANPQAYDSYLLGRGHSRRQSMAGWRLAKPAFERAIALDPGYAAAYAGLAAVSQELAYEHADPADVVAALAQARELAERAIAADPGEAEGYRIRGRMRSENEFDQAGALADLQRAVQINPGDSDNHQMLGMLLAAHGRFDEGEAALAKALALDPLSNRALDSLGELSKDRGDLRQAEALYRRALELAPDAGYSLSGLAQTQILLGKYADAQATVQRMQGDRPRQLYNRCLLQHSEGDRVGSDAALDELKSRFGAGWAFQVGTAYAWRGEADLAFDWLERAYRQNDGGLLWTKSDPLIAGLREDPRYPVLLRKLGLDATGVPAGAAP